MSARNIPPPRRHACVLGNVAEVQRGTLRRCATCPRWWRLVANCCRPADEWFPVRWWQWRLRRRIRHHEEEAA